MTLKSASIELDKGSVGLQRMRTLDQPYALRQAVVVEVLAKWVLLLVGAVSTGVLHIRGGSTALVAGVLAYGLQTLAFTLLYLGSLRTMESLGRWLGSLSYVADALFIGFVIYFGGDATQDLGLLFALLALRSGVHYYYWPAIFLLSCLLGPCYVVVLRLALGSWYFVAENWFLVRYAIVFLATLLGLYWRAYTSLGRRREQELLMRLSERTVELDNRTKATQQMAANLGNRVLELRSLQEGIKAINSALALEEVLRLIVANTAQVLQGARCSVTLVQDKQGRAMNMASAQWRSSVLASADAEWNQAITRWVVSHKKPVIVENLASDPRFKPTVGLPIATFIGVPLFLGPEAVGALIATASDIGAFTDEDLNLLGAFADQAAAAVANARLYDRLVQEQRQTEELYQHVKERRNELEAILRGIGDGVIVADVDLNLLLMNPVATRIFEVSPDVTSSLPLSTVLRNQELISLFQDALNAGEGAIVREIALRGVSRIERAQNPGGHTSESMVTTSPARAEIYQALASPVSSVGGTVRGVVTVLRDITSQKELEQMKSSFLSVVSHELKTPLHSIKGFVEIILMGKTGPINETQADFLGTVRDQTAHLQSLINDLLEFSRLESGQIRLRLSEVSVGEVSESVVEKLRPLADQSQVRLVNVVPQDIATIQADRMRIEQVLTNLVHNAIKFTGPAGLVEIRASDLGEQLQVTVADSGVGIPKGELERIFDRFYQVDSSSTRHYRGTGLGLTICKHIVEYHRGRIWAESEEGKGSTFFFILPKVIAEDEQLLLDFLSLPKKE